MAPLLVLIYQLQKAREADILRLSEHAVLLIYCCRRAYAKNICHHI